MEEFSTTYSVTLLLDFANVSRSGFYRWKKSHMQPDKDADIKQHLVSIHSIRPFFGYRRMTVALRREGYKVNYKRVYRLLKELGLQSVIRKKRKYYGEKGSIVFENLLNRQFKSSIQKQKLVTDITYLPTSNGFYYLSAVQDLYNNEIIAYSLSRRNNLELVLDTLQKLPKLQSPILHSDQGFQYTHKIYQQKLNSLGIRGSHSRTGNCLDNACIESFFSHLKTEMQIYKNTLNEKYLQFQIDTYIKFYNNERFQKKLDQLSPIEYREKLVA